MYSSLCHTEGLRPISRIKALYFYLRGYRFYMIVRNPQDRVLSFFKNKFRTTKNLDQSSLHLFYPYLKGSTKEEKRRKANLNNFIQILPMVYRKDGHLFPQYLNKGFYIKNLGLFIPFKNVEVYKMETDLLVVENELNISFIRKNQTKGVDAGGLNNLSISIVETLYQKDYEQFNYSRVFERPLDSHGMAFIRH